MKYNNPNDFKRDLDNFVESHAQTPEEQVDLRASIAIERFLSRIDPSEAIVQGGTAVAKLLPNSPYTTDVDIILKAQIVKEMGLDQMNSQDRANVIRAWLNDKVAERADDYVNQECVMIAPIMDLNEGFPSTKAFMLDKVGVEKFTKFQVDVALQKGDIPTCEIQGKDLLSFAEIPNPTICVMAPEYLVADKVTLFMSRQGHEHERPNDLAHAALLIQHCDLDKEKLAQGIAQYAISREVVDKLHDKIPNAPIEWRNGFEIAMKQAKSDLTLEKSLELISEVVEPVFNRAIELTLQFNRDKESSQ